MGTRCVIAREAPDGSIESAVCFLDGNPAEAGRRLLQHYTDPADIEALISLRTINSMGSSPHQPLDYFDFQRIPFDEGWEALANHCVTFAGRDDADEFQAPTLWHFAATLHGSWVSYAYVHAEGGWLILQPPDWEPASLAADPLANPPQPDEERLQWAP